MRRLTRRELALMLGAGAIAGTTRAEGSGPVALPGVVGMAEAKAKLGRPLSREQADRVIAGAMAAAVGAGSGVEAAASIFTPGDTVGIKVNCLAGRSLSPRVELVEALVDLLAGAGVDRRKIIVFERTSRELERAGFTIRRQGPPYRCVGTDNDYDRLPSSSGAIGGPRSLRRLGRDEELVRGDPQPQQVSPERLRPLHRRCRPPSLHPRQAPSHRA